MSEIDIEALPACTECGKHMRPRNAKLDDYPGTVPRRGYGRCYACRTRAKAPKPDNLLGVDALPVCSNCGRPMRPSHARIADWPGTVMRQRPDMCVPCVRHPERYAQDAARRREAEAEAARLAAQAAARAELARKAREAREAEAARLVGIATDGLRLVVDAGRTMTARLSLPLGRYDHTNHARERVVRLAHQALALALGRRSLEAASLPFVSINPTAGTVTITATVIRASVSRRHP